MFYVYLQAILSIIIIITLHLVNHHSCLDFFYQPSSVCVSSAQATAFFRFASDYLGRLRNLRSRKALFGYIQADKGHAAGTSCFV